MTLSTKRALCALWAMATAGKAAGVLLAATVALPLFSSDAEAKCFGNTKPLKYTVTVWGDNDCNGPVAKIELGKDGLYTDLKGWNDEISSIQIGHGVKLTAYWNEGFDGDSITFWPGDHPHLEAFGDEIGSLKMERIPDDEPFVVLRDTLLDAYGNPSQTVHYVGKGDFNFQGRQYDLLLAGKADEDNKQTSSIWMPQGVKITMYSGYDGKGLAEVRESSNGNLTINLEHIGWDNKLTSLKVERIPSPDEINSKPKYKIDGTAIGAWFPINPDGCSNCSNVSYSVTTGSEFGKEIGSETSLGVELSASISASAEVSAEPLGIGVSASTEITAGTAFSTGNSDSIVKSFSKSESTDTVSECDKGALWQWRTEVKRLCYDDQAACQPIRALGHTVCTTDDAIPPNGNPDWEGCKTVGYMIPIEGAGQNIPGVTTVFEGEYRCMWNEGTSFNGPVLHTALMSTKDPRGCRKACEAVAGCSAWSLNETDLICTMHSSEGHQIRTLESSSGIVTSHVTAVDEPSRRDLKTEVVADTFDSAALSAAKTVDKFLALGGHKVTAGEFLERVAGRELDSRKWKWYFNLDHSSSAKSKDGSWSYGGASWEFRGNSICYNRKKDAKMTCGDFFLAGVVLRLAGPSGKFANWAIEIK